MRIYDYTRWAHINLNFLSNPCLCIVNQSKVDKQRSCLLMINTIRQTLLKKCINHDNWNLCNSMWGHVGVGIDMHAHNTYRCWDLCVFYFVLFFISINIVSITIIQWLWIHLSRIFVWVWILSVYIFEWTGTQGRQTEMKTYQTSKFNTIPLNLRRFKYFQDIHISYYTNSA